MPTDEDKSQDVARSLDDMFSRAERARGAAPPAAPHVGAEDGAHAAGVPVTEPFPEPAFELEAPEPRFEPEAPEPVALEPVAPEPVAPEPVAPEPVAVVEPPLPPPPPPPSPHEVRMARVRAATELLELGVDAFVSGEGDVVAATLAIREAGTTLRDAAAIEPVVNAVERLALAADDDPAALALAKQLASPAACYGLALRIAGSRDEERRASLTRICTQLGPEAAAAVARAMAEADDRNHRRNLVNALAAMGELGMKQAEQMVQDGTWQVVRNGVSILAEVGGEKAVEHLVQTLAHHHAKVRNETVLALARIGGETPTLLILNKLDDADPHVRASAARAMGTLGTERTVRNLLERLEVEHEGEVQQELLRALGQIGDPGAVPAIEKRALGRLFKKPPTPVRVAAYRALSLIGTPHAKRLIEDAANDRDEDVRTVARSLLGKN
jgi:HEAT repeat protein